MDVEPGSGNELDQFRRNVRELRLVGEELSREPVHLERAFIAVPLRVDVAMEVAACERAVAGFDRGHFDQPVAQLRVETGRLGIEKENAIRTCHAASGLPGFR